MGSLDAAQHAKPRGLKFAQHFDGWVSDAAFSADGSRLATATSDGTISLFDGAGEPIGRLKREKDNRGVASAVALSPDGRWLACGKYDEKVHVVSVAGDAPEVVYDHDGAILDIAFSPSGKLLASAGVDRKIRLCNFGEAEFGLKADLIDHKSWVNSIAFDPHEKWLASGSSDGTVKIWSLETHKVLHTLAATNAEVYSIAVSPDGQHIAAGLRYGKLKSWNTETWKEELDFQAHDADIFAVAFSPDSQTLASGNGDWNRAGSIHLWNAATGEPTGKLPHTGEVLSLAWCPKTNVLAAGGGDKMLRVWDMSLAIEKPTSP